MQIVHQKLELASINSASRLEPKVREFDEEEQNTSGVGNRSLRGHGYSYR